jgi:hypothetical protein
VQVRLFLWNPAEAQHRAAELAGLGYSVDASPLDAGTLRGLRADPPDIALIDLSRSPSQGRDIALNLRVTKATRGSRLVFAGGTPEKVAGVRALLPDAIYTSWEEISSALEQALNAEPTPIHVPSSVFAGYFGAPLVKKLGIKPGMVIAALGEPGGFRELLQGLPDGVRWADCPASDVELILWFARTQVELDERITALHGLAEKAGLWILWPKKGASDLSERSVRAGGLAAGWVDYKIAAVDQTWSGLKFAWRK